MVLPTKRSKICVVVSGSLRCEHESHANFYAISLEAAIKTKYIYVSFVTPCISDTERFREYVGKKGADYSETHVMETSTYLLITFPHNERLVWSAAVQRGLGSWATGPVRLPWCNRERACRACLSSVVLLWAWWGRVFTQVCCGQLWSLTEWPETVDG